MLEHIKAAQNIDQILPVSGIDATLIGPYDLSASMSKPGQLDDPEVLQAKQTLLQACKKHNVPPGIHVVPVDNALLKSHISQGFKFIACGLDTEFIMHGCRTMLKGLKEHA